MASNAPQFRIITGDSPRRLLARLDADQTAAALSPFDDECIVVQSLGMERWVRQQLAMRRGAAASLQMPFPAAFCRDLATRLQPAHGGGGLDPRFEEAALTWRIAALLEAADELREPVYAPLATYLTGADPVKRYALARRLAARFDEYRLYRPDLLLGWEEGREVGPGAPHGPWQAALWRRLTRGEQPAHFARWFTYTLRYLETVAAPPPGLPAQVAVFGVSTLPPLFVQLLQALARFVPVTAYVLTPSAAGWQDGAPRHALEAAFGATARGLLAALTQHGAPTAHEPSPAPAAAPTLLAHLQHALRTGAAAPAAKTRIAGTDRSLLVHACHSAVRELEVLRDQLLDAFAADPTLRPHDVLVMVPDVEQYAPLAAIVFGDPHARPSPDEPDRPVIPYRLADRTLARDASAAQALTRLLDLVGSRVPASAVLDLLTLAPVHQAAGIAPAQLDQVHAWVQLAAIRWGRDGLDRGEYDLPSLEDFTWRQGLDRLVMGYATGRIDALAEGLLPVAGDTMGDTELLGAFVDWVDGVFARLEALRAPRPLAAWSATLQQVLAWLVSPDTPAEQAAFDRVNHELVQLARTATDPLGEAADRPVPFDVARRWLAGALGADAHDTGFLTGGLTLCAMKPMRAIPFKVIAVLGLDDRAFPRRERRAAFDGIAIDPRAGDRDAKADDRQLFLDTLLVAESRLILSWVGRSQQNNAEIAPSVVLSELLDLLDAQYDSEAASGASAPARNHVLVEHALQPFHPTYFAGANSRCFSFDARWARSLAAGSRRDPAPFATPQAIELPPLTTARPLLVSLADLMAAWTHPARFHARNVLQLRLPDRGDAVPDVEPSTVTRLDKFHIQQAMLERALRDGGTPSRSRAHDARLVAAAGQLPPGALGPLWYDELRDEFDAFWARLGPLRFSEPLAVDIAGPGWRLSGQLDGQVPGGQLRVRAARINTKDRVQGWIAHCAYAATGGAGTTVLQGLEETTGYAPLAAAEACAALDTLITAYRYLLVAPLPYFPEAGAAYWEQRRDRERALQRARDTFARRRPGSDRDPEAADPYVALLWRGQQPLDHRPDEFIAWCERLWAGLSAAESAYTAAGRRA